MFTVNRIKLRIALNRFGAVKFKTKSYGQLPIKFEPASQWRLRGSQG